MKEVWRKAQIELAKNTIKAELENFQQENGLEARLKYIIKRIKELEKSSDPNDLLYRFILTISALLHHLRWGGLSKKQLSELSELAEVILKVSGIKPGKSQVSFLYGELHYVLSEIHLSQGEFLPALWEHQVGSNRSTLTEEMYAIKRLGLGIYALRLGNSALAEAFLHDARSSTQDPITAEKTRVHQVRSIRISGRRREAADLCEKYAAETKDPHFEKEYRWELECCRTSDSVNPIGLINLSKRGQSHYETSYILECFLWIRAMPQTTWFQRMPKLASLGQYKEVRFRDSPILYTVASHIEAAYDTDIPFSTRLSNMKRILSKIPKIRNVDKELLSWLALTRWLYRNRYMEIAALTLQEYIALSRRLSNYEHSDVLGIASDLIEINWQEKIA